MLQDYYEKHNLEMQLYQYYLEEFQNVNPECQSPLETASLRSAETTNLSPTEKATPSPIKKAITILIHVL